MLPGISWLAIVTYAQNRNAKLQPEPCLLGTKSRLWHSFTCKRPCHTTTGGHLTQEMTAVCLLCVSCLRCPVCCDSAESHAVTLAWMGVAGRNTEIQNWSHAHSYRLTGFLGQDFRHRICRQKLLLGDNNLQSRKSSCFRGLAAERFLLAWGA